MLIEKKFCSYQKKKVPQAKTLLLQDVLCQVFVFLIVGGAKAMWSVSYGIQNVFHAGVDRVL